MANKARSVKEGHHSKWWTALREAYSNGTQLTFGLSGYCYVPMFVCKRVSHSGMC